jgi:hypothetical protein
MPTVNFSVSIDQEIANEMQRRLDSLKMGRSEYVANLIRNDLVNAGAPFQIAVDSPRQNPPKRRKPAK